MNEQAFQKIADYGKRYFDENIVKYIDQKDKLMNDHWVAMDYLFSKVFYQGRRDKISERVMYAAMDVLNRHFEIREGRWTTSDIDNIGTELAHSIGPVEAGQTSNVKRVGKRGDIKMVKGILNYLLDIPDRNIVKHTITTIQEKNIKVISDDLQTIHQIGSKISAFFLRDLVQIFDIDIENSKDEDLACLQPVDTWVRQVAFKLKIVEENTKDVDIPKAIVRLCANKRDAMLFNQGAWYLGANSFELLLENLQKDE